MHPHRSLIAFLILVYVMAAYHDVAVACVANRGDHVVLASDSMDPDVFIWDSMMRLADYTAGNFATKEVLRHTLLVSAGTEAVVVACRDHSVHPKFLMDPADAVGIKVATGRYRGRYGWVISGDLRVASRASSFRKP